MVDVAFGSSHAIITANIKVDDDDGGGGDLHMIRRKQILISAGCNRFSHVTSQVHRRYLHIPYEIAINEIGGDTHIITSKSFTIIEKVIAANYATTITLSSLSALPVRTMVKKAPNSKCPHDGRSCGDIVSVRALGTLKNDAPCSRSGVGCWD